MRTDRLIFFGLLPTSGIITGMPQGLWIHKGRYLMNLPGKYTLDRFEKEIAVLLLRDDETKEVLLSKECLPSNAAEGAIFFIEFNEDNSVQKVKLLEEETEASRQKVEDFLNKLKRK